MYVNALLIYVLALYKVSMRATIGLIPYVYSKSRSTCAGEEYNIQSTHKQITLKS